MTLIAIFVIVILAILSPLIVATIILFPYIRVGVLRVKMLIFLRSVAEERGFVWRYLRKFPLLSLNSSYGYDFLLVSKQKILVVKLWSAVNTQNTALVCRDKTLLERSVIPEPLAPGAKRRRAVRIKKRRFPTLESNFPTASKRPVERLILYCPKYSATYVQTEKGNIPLKIGSKLFGATVCDQKTIYRFL